MHWAKAIQCLRRERVPAVLVTIIAVRGHAPRAAGAKMVVTHDETIGTIGGGNLEQTAIARARSMLTSGAFEPDLLKMSLSAQAENEYGVQCCGGEVMMVLEPSLPTPAVAIFGMGHVGRELARVLSRHEIALHLVDSRAAQVDSSLLAEIADPVAEVFVRHVPVPETLIGELPSGTHVLIMSHDHAEDAALCDMALRRDDLGTLGLIGSNAKWARFRKILGEQGHSQDSIARIQCPIGIPQIAAKEPAAIAVGVAAQLLQAFADDRVNERSTR